MNDKRSLGLYDKYRVTRTDGADGPGGSHVGCDYFVLDLTHDPHAIPAILAYAESCERGGYAVLARDLFAKVARLASKATETPDGTGGGA